jgi:hypothetical protein
MLFGAILLLAIPERLAASLGTVALERDWVIRPPKEIWVAI